MQCIDELKRKIDITNQQIQEKERLISEYYIQINTYRKEIGKLQSELLKICDHNWVIDRDGSYYDRTVRYCSICGCDS